MKASQLPRGVWVLGFVSLLMDLSSEMIHSLLPLFLVGSLGVSVLVVGVIEGVAEATALIVRVFSGVWSDRLGRRKPLALLGYGIGAACKPLFALAGGAGLVVAARFADRVGKGLRGAPRDALVADLTPPGARGAAYGLRQALDTVGALLGPLVATALMLAWANDIRAVFWVAVIPAVAAVLLLALALHEPPRAMQDAGQAGAPGSAAHTSSTPNPFSRGWRATLNQLSRAYWLVVALGALVTLARFSEAFLVLRASELGLGLSWVPLAMVAMSGTYALAAYPLGALADRMSRTKLLAAGLLVLFAADVVLARASGITALMLGLVLWGLHMALTQGLLAAMVADAAPADLRGTAFGCFNLVSGVAMLGASVLAGVLWHSFGSLATFAAGALLAATALACLPLLRPSATTR